MERKKWYYKLANYSIDAKNSIQRILQYLKLNEGNNSTYFFFRTSYLRDIYALINDHPTKGGYLDWAITITLIVREK